MSAFIISAVIPTRNRPDDLAKAVTSVLAQTRLPNEFLIIDQSPGNESRLQVESIIADFREKKSLAGLDPEQMRLIYVHDTSITGLVAAKKVATDKATGDIVCFLEDDLVLEAEYVAQLEQGFIDQPEMLGCCGVMTNMPKMPFGYVFFFRFFHRGIFNDDRVSVLYNKQGLERGLIPCISICGGLSAWRREVFSAVPFDVENGFHMYEDVEFSKRVAMHFGPHLYLNAKVRAEHYWSPANRAVRAAFYHRKIMETVAFYKKRTQIPWAVFHLIWLLIGLFIEAGVKSVARFSAYPVLGYCSGLWAGMRKKIILQQECAT